MTYTTFRDKESVETLVKDIIAVLYCMDFAPGYFYNVKGINRPYTLHEAGGRNLSQITSNGTVVIKKKATSSMKNILLDDTFISLCYVSGIDKVSVLSEEFHITEYEMESTEYYNDEATWFQESIACNQDHLGARYCMSLLEESPIQTVWVSLLQFENLIHDLKTYKRYDLIHDYYRIDQANRKRKTDL